MSGLGFCKSAEFAYIVGFDRIAEFGNIAGFCNIAEFGKQFWLLSEDKGPPAKSCMLDNGMGVCRE